MIDVSDLVGVPFKVHGRSKEEGFDCYGLAIEVERRAGRFLPDVFYNNIKETDETRLALIKKAFDEGIAEKIDRLERYCVVDIQSAIGNHCGVYLGHGSVIHATIARGVVVQRIEKLNVKGYYRAYEN